MQAIGKIIGSGRIILMNKNTDTYLFSNYNIVNIMPQNKNNCGDYQTVVTQSLN